MKPARGSPKSCSCRKVDLSWSYSAGALVKCEQCRTVYRSTQKNSCPAGMKLFSPRSRADWKVFLDSAGPLRAPHWIIDVTRPQNGCGGCTRYPMKSSTAQQAVPHGGFATPGTTSPMATTLQTATWTCGGCPKVRIPFNSTMGVVITAQGHTIASPRRQSQRRRYVHRHQWVGQRVRHEPIALPSDGTLFGSLQRLSSVPSRALVLETIATLAPHGDWLSSRTAALTSARPEGFPRKLEVSIAATNHAGVLTTFLTVEFGRRAARP